MVRLICPQGKAGSGGLEGSGKTPRELDFWDSGASNTETVLLRSRRSTHLLTVALGPFLAAGFPDTIENVHCIWGCWSFSPPCSYTPSGCRPRGQNVGGCLALHEYLLRHEVCKLDS